MLQRNPPHAVAEQNDKPVRELLQDISRHSDFPEPPRGLVSPKLVDRVTFFVAVLSLLLISTTLLLMIWDVTDSLLGMRCIGSIVVLFLALVSFRAINSQFE